MYKASSATAGSLETQELGSEARGNDAVLLHLLITLVRPPVLRLQEEIRAMIDGDACELMKLGAPQAWRRIAADWHRGNWFEVARLPG